MQQKTLIDNLDTRNSNDVKDFLKCDVCGWLRKLEIKQLDYTINKSDTTISIRSKIIKRIKMNTCIEVATCKLFLQWQHMLAK